MEFTTRGTVHFHVLLSIGTTGIARAWLASEWYRVSDQGEGLYSSLRDRKVRDVKQSIIASQGHSRCWENVRSSDGAGRYVAKYASKVNQKIPTAYWDNAGRYWGASRAAREMLKPVSIVPATDDQVREMLAKAGDKRRNWEWFPRVMFGFPEIVSRETIGRDVS